MTVDTYMVLCGGVFRKNTVSNKTVQLQLQPLKHDCDLRNFGKYLQLVLILHTSLLYVGISTLVFRIFGKDK